MKRDMQEAIKKSKQEASELIKYANPKSRNRPSLERVTDIVSRRIPYRLDKPIITSISITSYSRNNLIKTARFKVETAAGKVFEISAYQYLTGRTQEQKEEDKTATFPSGLFNIFHSVIN